MLRQGFFGKARRGRLVASAAAALIALGATASIAQANPSASTITSPASGSYFYWDANAPSSTIFTVSGTTSGGSGNVDIDCYDGHANRYVLASNVTVSGGAFTAPISTSTLSGVNLYHDSCVLRAVPTGDSIDLAPGSVSGFSGPAIAITQKDADAVAGVVHDYDYYLNDYAGSMDFESAGDCGLNVAYLYAPGTLTQSSGAFNCAGALFDPGYEKDGSTWGGEIKVDGVEALDSDAAVSTRAGYEGIALTDSFSAGALTIHDDEPILDCVPSYASCTSYKSSGVELDRTWQSADDGLVAIQTDVFRSVDGAAHSVVAIEDDDIHTVNGPGAALMFPGSSTFQDYAENATVALPGGPGTILFKTDSATPAAGDATNPQGAITYDSAPNGGPLDFSYSDESASGNSPEFVLPYDLSVPAGGSSALRFSYVQDYALANVESLAQSTFTTVAITSPTSGATVADSPVGVSGTASDPTGIQSVTLNGQAATLGANGTWSAEVTLAPGANTLTAIATDAYGISAQQQETVLLPAATKIAGEHTTSKGIQVTVGCTGTAGQTCSGGVTLESIETKRGAKVIAVASRARRHKRTHKTVTVGSASYTVAAGQTQILSVKLNTKGLALLHHFHKLPVNATVTQTGQTSVVSSVAITVHPAKPKHHHKH
jgi:hypothetical protein